MSNCSVGKGVPEWEKHRPQAELGTGRWLCRDCNEVMVVDQAQWAAWVRRVIDEAEDALEESNS